MAPAQRPVAATDSAIDAILSPYRQPGAPGASVLVLQDGRPVYRKAFGSADLEAHVPATVNTDYRLASLTKAFTAMSIMLLVKDGKLHYDDRLVDVLPGTPAYAKDVRISHLLTHTSGLVDYEDFVPDSQTTQLNDDDVLQAHASHGLAQLRARLRVSLQQLRVRAARAHRAARVRRAVSAVPA